MPGAGAACGKGADRDDDGVPDATDKCPGTPSGTVVNASGCSVPQLCPCDNAWKNHGAYASCVAKAADDFLAKGLITQALKDSIVSEAARSRCGT